MKKLMYAAAALAALSIGAAPALAAPPADFNNPVGSVQNQVTNLQANVYGVILKECQFKTANPVYTKFDITQNMSTAVEAFRYNVKCNDRDTARISITARDGVFTNQDVASGTIGRTVDYRLRFHLDKRSSVDSTDIQFFDFRDMSSGDTYTSNPIAVREALGRGRADAVGAFRIIGDAEGGAYRAGRYTEQFNLTIGD